MRGRRSAPRRFARRDELATLDPVADHHEIYRQLVTLEFPWDMTQALSFALFRTYAVPAVGELLHHTGEFTRAVQRRYDDTTLLLDAVLEHGFTSTTGRSAVRRINQMHAAHDISPDDMRYVLATFVVVPARWLDRYGWRRLTDGERQAGVHYYAELGRHLGVRDVPADFAGFERYLDDYEAAHFGWSPGGRSVADATLDLFTTFPSNHLAPARLVRSASVALMDEPLRRALGYGRPAWPVRLGAPAALWLRGRWVRHLPVRTVPLHAREQSTIRSRAPGYDVATLGTWPARPAGTSASGHEPVHD